LMERAEPAGRALRRRSGFPYLWDCCSSRFA